MISWSFSSSCTIKTIISQDNVSLLRRFQTTIWLYIYCIYALHGPDIDPWKLSNFWELRVSVSFYRLSLLSRFKKEMTAQGMFVYCDTLFDKITLSDKTTLNNESPLPTSFEYSMIFNSPPYGKALSFQLQGATSLSLVLPLYKIFEVGLKCFS